MDRGLIQASTIQAGEAGQILLNVGTLTLTGGAQIVTSSALSATGPGGNLVVTASNGVSISGTSPPDRDPVSPFSQDRSSGLLAARARARRPDRRLFSDADATDGAKISVATTGPGAAGDIRIDAGTTTVASGARIDSSTSGTGKGGSLSVTAGNSVTLTGDSGLFSTTSSQGSGAGDAGSINVSLPSCSPMAGISVATTGAGAPATS
jgi:large exoprotein involved in heme utilization and adhesion